MKILEKSSPSRGNGQGPWGAMETDFIEALRRLVRPQKCELKGKGSVIKSQIEEGSGNRGIRDTHVASIWLLYAHIVCKIISLPGAQKIVAN